MEFVSLYVDCWLWLGLLLVFELFLGVYEIGNSEYFVQVWQFVGGNFFVFFDVVGWELFEGFELFIMFIMGSVLLIVLLIVVFFLVFCFD